MKECVAFVVDKHERMRSVSMCYCYFVVAQLKRKYEVFPSITFSRNIELK